MRGIFERTIWTVIALALSLIALNPWLAPGKLAAQGDGVVKVDIVRYQGEQASVINPIDVEVQRH